MPIDIPNLAGTLGNPLQSIGGAISQAPELAAKKQAAGEQAIAPYLKALNVNPALANSAPFTRQMLRISQQFGLPAGVVQGAIQSTQQKVAQSQAIGGAMQGVAQGAQMQAPGGPGGAPGAPGQPGQPGAPQGAPQGQGQAVPGQPGQQPGQQPQQQPGGTFQGGPAPVGASQQLIAAMAAAGLKPSGMQPFGEIPLNESDTKGILEDTDPNSAGRAARFGMLGVDASTVPSSIMGAPREMTEAQRLSQAEKIPSMIDQSVKAGLDPTGMLQTQVAMGVMTQQQADAVLSDPSYVQEMRQSIQLHSQTMMDNHLLTGAKYKKLMADMDRVNSVTDLNRIRAQYVGKEIQSFDAKTQADIESKLATADHAMQMIQDSQHGTWGQRSQASAGAVRDTQTAYSALVNAATAAQAAGNDPSTVNVGGVDLSTALKKANNARAAAMSQFQAFKSGKPQAASVVPKAGGGNPKPDASLGQPVAKDGSGKLVYKKGDSYIYADGTPYTP